MLRRRLLPLFELDLEWERKVGDRGNEDVDVLAGAFCMPRGSLNCEILDNKSIDPGTSSVSGSLSMPMLHAAFLLFLPSPRPPSEDSSDVSCLAGRFC